MKIFSPCKESLQYTFDSRRSSLDPGVTNLPEAEARHVVNLYHQFGVVRWPRNNRLQTLVKKEAENVWMLGNKKWAEEIVLDFSAVNKEKLDAGIPVEESDAVKKAKKFLGVK